MTVMASKISDKLVSIIFTGGTISSISTTEAGGAVPRLTGDALAKLIPDDIPRPRIRVINFEPRPSSHFSFPDVFAINNAVAAELADDAVAGVVVVQGTDVIEETSLFFDLLHTGPKPVVVTGSMRTADAPDYDGSRNLLDATLCAASPELRGQGVVVTMAGNIDQGDDVMKTHSTQLDTFASPNFGRLGCVSDGQVVIERRRGAIRHVTTCQAAGPVFVVEAGLAVDGEAVDALSVRRPAGLVVKATGCGNTHPDLLRACCDLMKTGVSVVITTRASAGFVNDTYAFPGGGGTWLRAGALSAGSLPASKARVALALGLGANLDPVELRRLLADPT